jgi:hypothetical protein
LFKADGLRISEEKAQNQINAQGNSWNMNGQKGEVINNYPPPINLCSRLDTRIYGLLGSVIIHK